MKAQVHFPAFLYDPTIGYIGHFNPSGKRMRRALRCILLGDPKKINAGSNHYLAATNICLREIGWWSSNITHILPNFYRDPITRDLDDACRSPLAQATAFTVAVLEISSRVNRKTITRLLTPEVETKLRPTIEIMKADAEKLQTALRYG